MRAERIISGDFLVGMVFIKFMVIHDDGQCTARDLVVHLNHYLPIREPVDQ